MPTQRKRKRKRKRKQIRSSQLRCRETLLSRYQRFVAPAKVGPILSTEIELLAFTEAPAPAALDWRERIAFSPAGHQGDCYSCTAFAVAAALELLSVIMNANRVSVAPGYLHTCLGNEGKVDAGVICASGVDVWAMLDLIQQRGCKVNTPGQYPWPPNACGIAGTVFRIAGMEEIRTKEQAKVSLATRGPLVADMYVWDDFFSFKASMSKPYRPRAVGAPMLHTVCVIGYTALGWIILNSMGNSWGDGRGCAVIPFDACGLLGASPPIGQVPRQAYSIRL